ncbi:uncharacterized protein LOC127616109 [Hippocampus zosterae]|uniref:uncharacterized protein LOC127616109 n=1 Tax=Hippocampus zosterae TaxID=109293 RepID=UPI00223CB631|nr:uncharacterized protein LOC127616109 [Hippocampus zosterae]
MFRGAKKTCFRSNRKWRVTRTIAASCFWMRTRVLAWIKMESEPSYISSQVLLSLTEKHFLKITPAHWALLAAGVRDPAIDMILADMCGEIVQTVATEVLRLVVPVLVEHLEGRASPDEMSSAIERCTPQLGDSIMTTFAAAADVPEVEFVGAKRFTALIEKEANVRMNSVLSSALSSSEGQSEPLLYVNATMSSVNTLYEMVCHAHKCLSYLSKMTQRFYRMSGLTPVDVEAATRSVAAILLKWAKEGREEPDEELARRSEDAQTTAEDIIQTMVQLQQRAERAASGVFAKPCIDMSAILAKVKRFFSSRPKSSTCTDELAVRTSLNTVGRSRFQKMMAGLKSLFKKTQPPFVVNLPTGRSGQSTRRRATGTRSSQKSRPSSQPLSEDELSSKFDSLTSNLMDWELETCTEEERRQLTDTVYEHLMATQDDESMSVRQHAYCNVLYAITDDTIKKYMQQLHLWLKVLRVNAKSRVEVSGALNEIDTFISDLSQSQPEAPSLEDGSSSGGVAPSSTTRTTASAPAAASRGGVASPPVALPSPTSSVHQAHVRSLVSALIVTLVMRLSWRCRSCTKITAILPVIKRLSERAVEEISPKMAAALADMDTYDAVIQAVARELSKEFDSSEAPLLVQNPGFDDAVFRHLKVQIHLLSSGAPLSSNNFLSTMTRVLTRPFLSLFRPATHPLANYN